MVNGLLALLPCASVAVHVTVVLPSAKVLPEAGVELTVTSPSTISSALAVKVTTAPAALVASAVMSAGTVIAGGVMSRTVTVKLPVALLPCASVAVAFTVVVPSAKVLPEEGVELTATVPSTISGAVAAQGTSAPAALVACVGG